MISLKDSRKGYPFANYEEIDGNELQLDWYLNYQEELDREYYERYHSDYILDESPDLLGSLVGSLLGYVSAKALDTIRN